MNEDKENLDSGAIRNKLDDVRYDLISSIALKRTAATYASGAERYGDNNWRKGIPFSNLLNHVIKHIFDYLEGVETDEDSLAHACWGLMALMEQESEHPEMNDLYFHNLLLEKMASNMINCPHLDKDCGSELPDGSYMCCNCGKWLKNR